MAKESFMRSKITLVIIVAVNCSLCFAKEYHYVSIQDLIEQEIGRLIIPKIYKKLGHSVTITPMPGKRAQAEVTSGRNDGEIMRIFTYGVENPTVERVETPYYYLETMAFVRKGSGIVISSREDLRKYKIAKVRGVKHTNNITEGLSRIQDLDNTEQMMRFLKEGRAEVALTNKIDGKMTLKRMGYDEIIPSGRPLKVLDLFHYIHKKHKGLAEKVNSVIKKMKASGELDKIVKEAEKAIIDD